MLSEALQRNAKHEASLSNISDVRASSTASENNQGFFASLRMTKVPFLL
jgi:hypothetical protein